MDILVGCSSGVNKIYNIHKKCPTGIYGKLESTLDLNVMTYGWDSVGENNEDYVFYGYSNGKLRYWNQKEKVMIGELDYGQAIKSIHTLSNDKLLVALESGLVDVKTFSNPITSQLTPLNLPTLSKKKQSAASAKNKNPIAEPINTQSFSLNVANNISGFAMNSSKDKFALGGKEVNLNIWDLEKQVKIYNAKFKHDFLNLQEPVDINSIKYMNDDKVVIGSGFRLKAYDTRSNSRNSFLDVSFSKHPIQCVQYSQQTENYFYASDSIGKVFCYDIRTSKQVGSFKENTGSVRDIAIHPTLPLLATVGLDRFLRVYDLKSRRVLHKIFLKQRLSQVLFSKEVPTIEDTTLEEEELWKNLDENKNNPNDDSQGKKRTVSIKVTDNMDSDDDDDEEDGDDNDDLPMADDSDDDGLDGSDEDISEFMVKNERESDDSDSDEDSDSDDEINKKPKRKTPAKSNIKNNKNNNNNNKNNKNNNNNNNNNNNKKTSSVLKKKLSGLRKSRK